MPEASQATARKPARIVVICPVYNEEQNISYFFERMKAVLEQLDPAEYSFSLLFTNNRSTDGSLMLLEQLRHAHDWVGYLTLSRNHGYQLSVLSGLASLRADLYMICDVDCEDPPEMLHEFLARIRDGHDLAYGIRNNRQDSWLIGRCRSLFYVALRALGDFRIVPYMAEFAMFKRCVRDVVIAGHNSAPFLRAEYGYAGFDIVGVPYRRDARRFGKTHYNFYGNLRFAIAGMLASTTFPLRAVFYALPAVCLLTLGLCVAFVSGLIGSDAAIVSVVSLNALYMSGAVAFISIYLARTYHNGVGRKRFIIDPTRSSLPRVKGAGAAQQGERERHFLDAAARSY
jgi:polyisoprenyl-phosphate glycosyltransferase